jgi:hypothetical protein
MRVLRMMLIIHRVASQPARARPDQHQRRFAAGQQEGQHHTRQGSVRDGIAQQALAAQHSKGAQRAAGDAQQPAPRATVRRV